MSAQPLHRRAVEGYHLDLDPTLPPFTVAEEAEILGLSQDVIYDGVRRGEIRALRLGRAIRITRAETARLLQVSAGEDQSPAADTSTPDGGARLHDTTTG